MASFYRSGLLALTLVSGSFTVAQAQVQRITHQAWVSGVATERLRDKSVLTEYFGESPSKEHNDVVFRVGFIPRFSCSPLITVLFPVRAIDSNQSDDDSSDFPDDLGILNVSIDGADLPFPSVSDDDSTGTSVYMDSGLQRRLTARLRIQVGDQMRLVLANGKTLSFSLSGSQEAINTADQNCLRHDPLSQG